MTNFAQLGIQINSDSAKEAAGNLDAMAASGAKAEKAADSLKKSTTDWAKEQEKANARVKEMESAESRRANSAKRSADVVRQQQQELSKLIGTIDPTVAALDRLDKQQQQLAKFRKAGILDTTGFNEYNSKIEQQRKLLGGLSTASDKAGMSAKQLAFATRGLPAQFTDIAVSLQGGQRPLNVLLQQGGQLKDMFGGIGPAARAMGGYIAGLINPFTVAAGAVAALALAWKQGSDEAFEFNKAVILTGNYAKLTAADIKTMGAELNNIAGVSAGGARDALMAVVQSGKFTGEQFELVAKSAARMSASLGVSLDTTISKFEEIKKSPLDALIKLNEAENFLTKSQYDRIRALELEGDSQKAVAEALRIYANASDDMASRAEQNMPAISKGWRSVKDEISGAWGEVKTYMSLVGEAVELTGKLFGIDAQSSQLGAFARSFLPSERLKLLNAFSQKVVDSRRGADFSDVSSRSLEDPAPTAEEIKRNEIWEARLQTLDKTRRQEAEIAKIRREGAAAGATEAEIAKQILLYKQQQLAADTKRSKLPVNSDENSARTLIETAQRQIVANEQLATSGEKVTASGRLIIQINQRLADSTDKMTEASRRELEANRDLLAASEKEAAAAQQKQRDLVASIALTEQLTAATEQQARARELEIAAIGMGSADVKILTAQLKARQDYLDKVKALDKRQQNESTAISQAEYARQKGQLQAHLDSELAALQEHNARMLLAQGEWVNGATKAFADYSAEASNIAALTENLFTNAFSSMEDALVNFVVTGKLNFQDFANSIIKDLARIAAKQMITGIVGNFMGRAIGGPQMQGIGLVGGAGAGGSWSSGGYTGPGGVYQPAGIVHKGEVVWSQRDVAAVGGPQRANAMRPTAGYAMGGIVGGGRGVAGKLVVEIENKGQPVQAKSASMEQQPDGSTLIRVMLDAVADNVASGGSVAKAIKGRLNVSERV